MFYVNLALFTVLHLLLTPVRWIAAAFCKYAWNPHCIDGSGVKRYVLQSDTLLREKKKDALCMLNFLDYRNDLAKFIGMLHVADPSEESWDFVKRHWAPVSFSRKVFLPSGHAQGSDKHAFSGDMLVGMLAAINRQNQLKQLTEQERSWLSDIFKSLSQNEYGWMRDAHEDKSRGNYLPWWSIGPEFVRAAAFFKVAHDVTGEFRYKLGLNVMTFFIALKLPYDGVVLRKPFEMAWWYASHSTALSFHILRDVGRLNTMHKRHPWNADFAAMLYDITKYFVLHNTVRKLLSAYDMHAKEGTLPLKEHVPHTMWFDIGDMEKKEMGVAVLDVDDRHSKHMWEKSPIKASTSTRRGCTIDYIFPASLIEL